MSSRSWAIVSLCLGLALAGVGCRNASVDGSVTEGGSVVDDSGDGTLAPTDDTTTPSGDDVVPSSSTPNPTPTPEPTPEVFPEICNDGLDNDGNGVTDCTDSACASDSACEAPPADDGSTDDPTDPAPECLSCPDSLTKEHSFDPPVERVEGNRAEYHPSNHSFDKDSVLLEYKAGVREYYAP